MTASAHPAPGRLALIERRQAPPSGRLDSIQLLRAVAVLMVALYHLTVLFPDPLAARWAVPDPLFFGYAGVDLFFLISGFIITHVTRREHVDVAEFAWKRVFRILPLYWAISLVLVAIWAVRPEIIPIRSDSAGRFFLDSFLLVPTPERPLLGVGWTLQHEFQFYVLMALLMVAGLKRWSVHALMLIFALGVYQHVIVYPNAPFWDWKLLSLYSFQFALGIIAYRINARWHVRAAWPLLLIGVAGFVITSTIVTPLMEMDREVDVVAEGAFGLLRVLGYGAASFAMLIGALNLGIDDPDKDWPGRRLTVAVGDASYVIYLTHNLVLQFVALFTRRFDSILVSALGSLVAIVMIVVVGLVVHRLVERPLLAFLERRVIPIFVGHGVKRLTLAARRKPNGETDG